MMKTALALVLTAVVIGKSIAEYVAVNVTQGNTKITATLVSSRVGDISPLSVDINLDTSSVHIKIVDPNNERYEVPYPAPEDTKKHYSTSGTKNYEVNLVVKPFSISIHRLNPSTEIFNTAGQDFSFTDQLITIGSGLPSTLLYGLGEDSAPLLRDMDNKKHTMWANGAYYEQRQGVNLYGSHPFYLNVEAEGSPESTGVLMMNSNAMDVLLTKKPSPSVTWKTIGGVIDMTVFVGDSPLDVIRLYNEKIGKPFLPPVWALGFHLCRWGYNNTGYMASVMEDMILQGVPVDVQWNDIDYMSEHEDFTISPDRFADLPRYVDYLHMHGKRYVAMMDPAIHARFNEGYAPLESGLEMDVFVRNTTGDVLIGNVWPGDTVFPDFLAANTSIWWKTQLSKFSKSVSYDGIWIDMNEPQNFYDGSAQGCPWNDPLEKPPYLPGVRKSSLQWQTLCMTARHHQYRHYDVHNLYGWSEAHATRAALKYQRPDNRTFLLSRSTFVGSGRWAAHWTGDISASWSDMAATIPSLINFNMYGIPLVGADICGFNGDSNEELCTRWSQLGAFYPFSRNHNTLFARAQEPTAWGTETTAIIRSALLQRYRLMLYLYNQFVRANEDGTPVMQALFMQFPEDTVTYNLDRQFLLGSDMMVCPVLEKGAKTVWIYFPSPSLWYSMWTLELASPGGKLNPEYPAPRDTIPVFARGGSIIPVVMETGHVTPTAESVLGSHEISLNCYLDTNGEARGELFVDDGLSESAQRPSHHAQFRLANQTLTISGDAARSEAGFVRQVRTVRIGGVGYGSKVEVFIGSRPQPHVQYDADTGVMVVSDLIKESGEPVTTDTTTAITWKLTK